jgi:hypothetical protein
MEAFKFSVDMLLLLLLVVMAAVSIWVALTRKRK